MLNNNWGFDIDPFSKRSITKESDFIDNISVDTKFLSIFESIWNWGFYGSKYLHKISGSVGSGKSWSLLHLKNKAEYLSDKNNENLITMYINRPIPSPNHIFFNLCRKAIDEPDFSLNDDCYKIFIDQCSNQCFYLFIDLPDTMNNDDIIELSKMLEMFIKHEYSHCLFTGNYTAMNRFWKNSYILGKMEEIKMFSIPEGFDDIPSFSKEEAYNMIRTRLNYYRNNNVNNSNSYFPFNYNIIDSVIKVSNNPRMILNILHAIMSKAISKKLNIGNKEININIGNEIINGDYFHDYVIDEIVDNDVMKDNLKELIGIIRSDCDGTIEGEITIYDLIREKLGWGRDKLRIRIKKLVELGLLEKQVMEHNRFHYKLK